MSKKDKKITKQDKILAMLHDKKSVNEIAKGLNTSKCYVYRIKSKFGFVEHNDNPFTKQIKELKLSGFRNVDIAKKLSCSLSYVHKQVSIQNLSNPTKKADIKKIMKLHEDGMSIRSIAKKLNRSPQSIRERIVRSQS